MSGRHKVIYVTSDSQHWTILDVPDGVVTPPTLTLHVPLAGPLEFYYADCYRLPYPAEAKEAAR